MRLKEGGKGNRVDSTKMDTRVFYLDGIGIRRIVRGR